MGLAIQVAFGIILAPLLVFAAIVLLYYIVQAVRWSSNLLALPFAPFYLLLESVKKAPKKSQGVLTGLVWSVFLVGFFFLVFFLTWVVVSDNW